MKLVIPVEPMGTVRMTAGMVKRIKYRLYGPDDKKALQVLRYLKYKELLAWAAREHYKSDPMSGPIEANLTFFMPIPDSWSKKKQDRFDGQPHTSKPDRDNLEKGVLDSFNKIVWKDDGQVCDGRTRKFYSREPRIEIEIKEVGA